MRRYSLIIVATVVVGLLAAAPALAATFVVTSSADTVDIAPGDGVCENLIGGCTLRAAIQEANALAGTDTITLPGTLGTYFFQLPGTNENAAATGDLDITSTIIINGAGASTTIIHANNSDRVFDVRSGSLTLNNVTVRNGEAGTDPDVGLPIGGGILVNSGTSLTLTDSIVRLNETEPGGAGAGILAGGFETGPATTVAIANSTITQNFAPNLGGTCTDDCEGVAAGIGMFGKVTATITNSTISGNTAGIGGGIGAGSAGGPDVATVTITNSTISGNTASEGAGGVFAGGGPDATGTMTIANSTISGNTAGEGGALGYGDSALVILTNVTITNNSSGMSAAINGFDCGGFCPPGELRVRNTIIANNIGAASANCGTGGGNNLTDLGNNLEFPGTSCGFGLSSDVHANPLLGPLASNGGQTQTHALLTGSPAIDAGSNQACAASPVSGIDQRGLSRAAGARCDIGSYEFDATTGPPLSQDTRVLDLDGDGMDDLVWRDTQSGDVAVWLMDGGTVRQGSVVASGVPLAWQIHGVGDFDGDTMADLLWRHTQTGDVVLWLMDGATVRAGPVVTSGMPLVWQIVGVGDLNGDGMADLVWRNTQSGDVAVWLMNGATVMQGAVIAPGVPLAWQLSGVNDLDGDGQADLVWRQSQTGDVAVWLMDGATITQGPVVASGVPLAWQIAGVDDLDGDGNADLVWRDSQTGDVSAWLMDGATITAAPVIALGVPLEWQIANVEDVDGDDKADLVWHDTQAGDVSVWLMDGATIREASAVASGMPLAWQIQ